MTFWAIFIIVFSLWVDSFKVSFDQALINFSKLPSHLCKTKKNLIEKANLAFKDL